MRYLKCCLNPKVVAALAAVAVGVWVFAPGAVAGALPLLIVAVCPLSMIGMMYMMRGGSQGASSSAGARCDAQGTPEEPVQGSGEQDDGRAIEALRDQVAELEARLAVGSGQDETRPSGAAAPHTASREGDG